MTPFAASSSSDSPNRCRNGSAERPVMRKDIARSSQIVFVDGRYHPWRGPPGDTRYLLSLASQSVVAVLVALLAIVPVVLVIPTVVIVVVIALAGLNHATGKTEQEQSH